jgi:hypothetical protein
MIVSIAKIRDFLPYRETFIEFTSDFEIAKEFPEFNQNLSR